MRRFVMAAALAFAAAGSALAADLPQPPPPPPQAPATYVPTVAPVYNWGGIYFGANGGYGFGDSKWTIASVTTGTFDVSGFVIGPTVGVNYQTDAFVFGVEGDFDGSWIKGTTNTLCISPACQTNNNWLATARVRGGYAADRVLFYVTGGGAFGSILANTSGTTLQKENEPGWAAGAGVEAALTDNITARAEYLYVDLQHASLTSPIPTAPVTVDFSASFVRLGLDYKFR